jgi:hypothetical protein
MVFRRRTRVGDEIVEADTARPPPRSFTATSCNKIQGPPDVAQVGLDRFGKVTNLEGGQTA